MAFQVTREEIYNSYSLSQLLAKKQDLLDLLAFSSDLGEDEVTEINQFIRLIEHRIDDWNEWLGF
jgi:hypothetical protein